MTTQHASHAGRHMLEDDQTEGQAFDIVVLLLSGDATVAHGDAIRDWCADRVANRAAFGEAVRIWRGFARAAGALAEVPPVNHISAQMRTQGRRREGPLARGRTVDAKKSPRTLRKLPPRSV